MHEALAEAQQHGEVAAVLDDLGAAAFFASQLAKRRHDRGEQLDDDGGADVGHDAQRADGAVFEGAPGEHAVHAQHAAAPAWFRKKSAKAAPLRPGTRTTASRRQMARTIRVNKIRDFSSGILKQLLNVLAMAASMAFIKIRSPNSNGPGAPEPRLKFGGCLGTSRLGAGSDLGGLGFRPEQGWPASRSVPGGRDEFARPAFGLDLGFGRGAEGVGADREFPGQFAVAQDFDPGGEAVGQAGVAEGGFINPRAVLESG